MWSLVAVSLLTYAVPCKTWQLRAFAVCVTVDTDTCLKYCSAYYVKRRGIPQSSRV